MPPQLPINTHNHLQLSTTTQKLPKKAKTCQIQLFTCTLEVDSETDVGFDSDIKQWYIYILVCVSVCIYFIKNYIY